MNLPSLQTIDRSWYDQLREQYRPDRIHLLLIGESPPDPASGERRFFYSPELKADNLFRSVAIALYGPNALRDSHSKSELLRRFRSDGLWLIDAVSYPVNHLRRPARRRAIRAAVPSLVERCRSLNPSFGVVICHGGVYEEAISTMREAGVRVLHESPLPFPLGNWRAQFVQGFQACLPKALQDLRAPDEL